jgi:predicted ester cyclase
MTLSMHSDKLRQRRRDVVERHLAAENAHDPVGTAATFSGTVAEYDIAPFGDAGQVPGHDAIADMFTGFFAVFPDFHIEPQSLRHGDDHVLVEAILSGTQQLDWNAIKSTGRSFRCRMLCVYEFADDVLVREQVFFDFADVARQLKGDYQEET